jgi:hypothetical protein
MDHQEDRHKRAARLSLAKQTLQYLHHRFLLLRDATQTSGATRRQCLYNCLYDSSASLTPQESNALFYVIKLIVLDDSIVPLKVKC